MGLVPPLPSAMQKWTEWFNWPTQMEMESLITKSSRHCTVFLLHSDYEEFLNMFAEKNQKFKKKG